MNKHDNIYNILGKLAALQPATAEPAKQESILKQLNESAETKPLSLKDRLNARFAAIKEGREVDEDMLANKDYDGDGKKESGKDEYMGSKDKAIKKAMGKKDVVDEAKEKTMSRAAKGYEKYGKEGMEALAKAGREGKDLDKVRAKYDKYDESVSEGVTTQSWMKDPEDPASKIPAFQRKANEPGRQAAQANVDDLNQKSGAAVWRNPRAVQPTMDEDGDNAYATLPEVRNTSEEEHSEYKAATHELRKWMRKRGWDTKKEFKSALKYVMDNLDSKHDDTLTDKVKEAACTCDKHHKALVAEQPVEEGFPTVADAKARAEKEKGTGKFDVQKTSTGTRYTRKPETFDDSDENSAEKSDGPKKKGRPAKAKAPERTTSKAWKHKDGRVTESINIETYVEDTIAELEALFIIEKDMGKHNNATTGFDAVAKKAGGGKKGQAIAGAQFQKMKKAGQLEEGVLVENTLQAIVRKFGKEVREFAEGGDIDKDLFEALYDYYFDDMPYAIKTDDPYEWIGDHFYDAIQNGDVKVAETKIGHRDLDELALLAGLTGGQHKLDKNNDDKLSAVDFAMLRGDTNESSCNMTAEGQYCEMHGMNECGMMEGTGMKQTFAILDDTLIDQIAAMNGAEVDPDAGSVETWDENTSRQLAAFAKANPQRLKQTQSMNTAGMKPMAQAVGGTANGPEYNLKEGEKKPDFTDVDDDDDETESWTKAVDDKKKNPFGNKKELDECGDMGPMGGADSETGVSINSSMDTKTGRKSLTVTADGEAAEQLAKMLKMAGLAGGSVEPETRAIEIHTDEMEEEFANEPEEQYGSVDAIMSQGGDLNRPKMQDPATANRAANPMSEDVSDLINRLQSMYARIK